MITSSSGKNFTEISAVKALCACPEFLPEHKNFETNFAMAHGMNVVSFFSA